MTSIQESKIELIFTKPFEVQSFGDFKVQKKYYVPNSIGGKMIQIIKKKTEVSDASGNKYSTSKDITKYTSVNVKFSNDDYVEVFQMVKGKSVHDNIQNGALTRYDYNNDPYIFDSIYDDERLPYLTVGKIDVIGKGYYLLPDKYKVFADKFKPIIDYDGPANGLPTFPLNNEDDFKNVVEWLNNNSKYGPLNHEIEVKWNNDRTILSNFVNKKLDDEIVANHYVNFVEDEKKATKKSKSSPDKSKSPQTKSKSPQTKSKSPQTKPKSSLKKST